MSADQITPERIAELEKTLANLKLMTRQGVSRGKDVEITLYPKACADVLEALEWQENALAASRAEVQRLTEEARRSDAGRVEVPELTDAEAAEICNRWNKPSLFSDRNMVRDAYMLGASRLSPSPQPATGPMVEVPDVAIPMGTALQRLGARLADLLDDEAFNNIEANYLIPAIRELETAPQPSADVVVVPRTEWAVIERLLDWVRTGRVSPNEEGRCMCGSSRGGCENDHPYTDMAHYYWASLKAQIDALRSSTNHDAQDAGEGSR